MDGKWLAILAVGLAVAMFGPLAFTEKAKGDCRVAAIQAGMDADSIIKVCK